MGNHQERASQPADSDTGQANEDPCVSKLQRTFQAFDIKEDSLLLEEFRDLLFEQNPTYGELLFNTMVKSVHDPSHQDLETHVPVMGLSNEQFVEEAHRLLQIRNLSDQLKYYFLVFTKGSNDMNKQDFCEFLGMCYHAAWSLTGIDVPEISKYESFLAAILASLFGSKEAITSGDLASWCSRQCPLEAQALHTYTASTLCGGTAGGAKGGSGCDREPVQALLAGRLLLSPGSLWCLSCILPMSFIPMSDPSPGDSHIPGTSNYSQLANIMSPQGWTVLYDSNNQGLSVNRFQHHVLSYSGPTLLLLQFPGHLYCVAVDTEWKESSRRWGGNECKLIQLLPQYRLIQDGASMIYYNLTDRSVPKGLQFGKDAKTTFLTLDEEFHNVKHYGVDARLEGIEVWGCGGPDAVQGQAKQKKWEHQQADMAKNRKLKLEDWKDNPDRHLLEHGGVTTEHAQK